MKVLFTSSFLLIYHDGFGHALELEWLGVAESEELRAGMLEGLRLAELYHARAWIGNLRRMRAIRAADQEWLANEWFPRFSHLDITHLALVESDDALNRQGVTRVLQRASGLLPLCTRWFDDVADARAWVRASVCVFQPL